MVVTVDTNILYQALHSRGASYYLMQLVFLKQVNIAISNSVLSEYRDVLLRPSSLEAFAMNHKDVIRFLDLIYKNAKLQNIYFLWRPNLRDEADNIFVELAMQYMEMLSSTTKLRDKLERNTKYFRKEMTKAGFDILPGEHPIVPIMLYDAVLSQKFADALLKEGIYVIGFFYPVVPKDQARIRVQLSAAHTKDHLKRAVAAFTKVGKSLGVI